LGAADAIFLPSSARRSSRFADGHEEAARATLAMPFTKMQLNEVRENHDA
jgi:hypothetical protein